MITSIEQILNEGIEKHKKGNFKEAKHFYNKILEKLPDHCDANHNLGILETSLNNHRLAKKFFENALKSNPKIKQFWVSYITNLINLKDFKNAELTIEKGKSFKILIYCSKHISIFILCISFIWPLRIMPLSANSVFSSNEA